MNINLSRVFGSPVGLRLFVTLAVGITTLVGHETVAQQHLGPCLVARDWDRDGAPNSVRVYEYRDEEGHSLTTHPSDVEAEGLSVYRRVRTYDVQMNLVAEESPNDDTLSLIDWDGEGHRHMDRVYWRGGSHIETVVVYAYNFPFSDHHLPEEVALERMLAEVDQIGLDPTPELSAVYFHNGTALSEALALFDDGAMLRVHVDDEGGNRVTFGSDWGAEDLHWWVRETRWETDELGDRLRYDGPDYESPHVQILDSFGNILTEFDTGLGTFSHFDYSCWGAVDPRRERAPSDASGISVWLAADMLVGRRNTTATRLLDGSVLVVGGYVPPHGVLQSVELYDPVLGTWQTVADMALAREQHGAALLATGEVLVVGGNGEGLVGTFIGQAEAYDPSMDHWREAGQLNNARTSHSVTVLEDGRALVAGGLLENDTGPFAEIFEPATNNFVPVGPGATTVRRSHTATLLNDGRVLIAGGWGDGQHLSSALLYDPVDDTFRETSSLTEGRSSHTATLLADGRVLVVGGYVSLAVPLSSVEIYDPTTESWSMAPPLSVARRDHSATLLPPGWVLVIGGGGAERHERHLPVEVFFSESETWHQLGELNFDRVGHTATLLENGLILVAGGSLASSNLRFVELIDVGLESDGLESLR